MPKGLPAGDLKKYKDLLVKMKVKLLADYSQLEEGALKKNSQEASGDLSSMPSHLADLGSDSFEQKISIGLLEGEQEELRLISEALKKIVAKTFGVCDGCAKPISKSRLKAIPYVKFCLECQKKAEKG